MRLFVCVAVKEYEHVCHAPVQQHFGHLGKPNKTLVVFCNDKSFITISMQQHADFLCFVLLEFLFCGMFYTHTHTLLYFYFIYKLKKKWNLV